MVFASMEGKLHLYEHGHETEPQALENVVQTPLNRPFDHEDLLWEVVIWHIRMQQGPCFVEVALIPTTRMFNFIVGEEGQDGEQCSLQKTHHPP
jgi:hypothetical protein